MITGWWFLTILKNMKVNVVRMTSHILWENNPAMFETTSQNMDKYG